MYCRNVDVEIPEAFSDDYIILNTFIEKDFYKKYTSPFISHGSNKYSTVIA